MQEVKITISYDPKAEDCYQVTVYHSDGFISEWEPVRRPSQIQTQLIESMKQVVRENF